MAQSDIFFNEIYSTYYRVVEKILREAQTRKLTSDDISNIAKENGFAESGWYIPDKLKSKEWPLLLDDMTTPLTQPVGRPVTLLEKRWLKALLLDPRIKLFAVDATGLEDVEPLFRPEQFVYFDQYTNGDDFQDSGYQQRFRVLLQACEQKRLVELEFKNNRGETEKHVYLPMQLEYSAKDDKFRLRAQKQDVGADEYNVSMVNLGRITGCKLLEQTVAEPSECSQERCVLEFLLIDKRNALERALLHFSGMKKRTEKLTDVEKRTKKLSDDDWYRLHLIYNKSDELELVIRVLSFGPLLKLERPKEIKYININNIKEIKEKESLQKKNGELAEYAKQREHQAWFWNELHRRLAKQAALLAE